MSTRRARVRRLLAVGAVSLGALLAGSAPAAAHDDIAGSTPESRSTLDEPISTVEIDFGEVISDDVAMFLTYDLGDNEFEDIGGTTVRTGDTTARLDFDEVEREGTYFVQYLAPVPIDGHVIAGAVSFTYGEPSSGGSDAFPVIPFIAGAVVVLAVGGWFSYRRMLAPDEPDADPDAPAAA
ncbi:copper resistance CopC family protein [Ilumatobacter nonamiensis]|uniref:copper resistance CopC family protein n=1 Tax=Ilumatobacter nonamiensis TaxID=467093 RepID=UPI00130E035B|nr:copper resistance protein CopC [Ilumatobacter nonamiensis]